MTKNDGMTAHELARELLAGPDLPVRFAYNYGDHWRTRVAAAVETIDTGLVTHSAYHGMDKVVEDGEDGPGEDEKNTPAIILS